MPLTRPRSRPVVLVLVAGMLVGSLATTGVAAAEELEPSAPPAADALATDAGEPTVAAASVSAAGAAAVSGYGYGHGRGLGQYGALGYAVDRGWSRDQILAHFYGGTVAGTAPAGAEWMSVRLMAQDGLATTVAVGGGNGLSISFGDGSTWGPWIYTGAPAVRLTASGTAWTFEALAGCGGPAFGPAVGTEAATRVRIRPARTDGALIDPFGAALAPTDALQLCGSAGTTTYRGELQAVNDAGTQRTVNLVPTELYLRGVVPREMPASWADLGSGAGAAALQAQSVAARTYAIAESRWSYAKTCDTTACQVYAGWGTTPAGGTFATREDSRASAAIDATAGLVRLRGGAVVRTEFSSSTGGMTAGGTFPVVVDEGDATSRNPNRTWTTSLSAETVEARYARSGLVSIEVIERNGYGADGGRATKVRITFSDGSVIERTGNQFRVDFGLKSDWYSVSYTPTTTAPVPVTHPVMTGYTDSEYVDLTAATSWLQVSPEEFQRIAIWVTAFLIGLSRNPDGVERLDPLPTTEGPIKVTTAYLDEDVPAFLRVMHRWTLTPPQAQKVAATVMVFLTGIDRARRGG